VTPAPTVTPDASTDSSRCPSCGADNPLAEQVAALTKQVEELTEQVNTDGLTGLYNFRHFNQALEHEIERSRRTGQPTTLLLIDLDHFKRINDTWGHEVGNLALIETAKTVRAAIRKLDIPCRYGGEEFIVILPSTDLLTGAQVAERLRQLIEEIRVPLDESELQFTASLGIDVYNPTSHEPARKFIERVDALLYQAKQGGRNQVAVGTREDLEPTSHVSNDEKDALFGLFSGEEKPE
jgi:two-component system, cell cycle response regulator